MVWIWLLLRVVPLGWWCWLSRWVELVGGWFKRGVLISCFGEPWSA